jgi:energy-coupling factor transporter ATP-binding protein EcfA2
MTLVLEHVDKRFGANVAAQDVSFSVPEASVFGLLGPNGAGKTTTIRMIVDILRPDAGQILWHGTRAHEIARRAVGYMPEERGLYAEIVLALWLAGRIYRVGILAYGPAARAAPAAATGARGVSTRFVDIACPAGARGRGCEPAGGGGDVAGGVRSRRATVAVTPALAGVAPAAHDRLADLGVETDHRPAQPGGPLRARSRHALAARADAPRAWRWRPASMTAWGVPGVGRAWQRDANVFACNICAPGSPGSPLPPLPGRGSCAKHAHAAG